MVEGLKSKRVDVPDSSDAINELAYRRGWTDGLPIVAPTEEKVAAMLQEIGRDPGELIVRVPPALGKATVEKIAINAVMAGCLPSYAPVIIAALEAMCEPDFNLNGIQATTNPVAPATIVNGPVRKKLDINCGANCLGQGWRANATIGRAIRFLLLNIGGAAPGPVDKAVHGQPAKYTLCFGEDEEGSVWDPLHVERGFEREDSAVTVVGMSGTTNILTAGVRFSDEILMLIGNTLAQMGSNDMFLGGGQPTVVLASGHAALFKSEGYSKEDVKQTIYDQSGVPEDRFPKERREKKIMWVDKGLVRPVKRPEDIVLVVAGAPQPYHIACMPTFGTSRAQTKAIRL
ncbi:MAG: hypothetical protein HYX92_02885 [Chloroflexi bacterium]|nr:hypothetical protein [Chloroflexota bacterium]